MPDLPTRADPGMLRLISPLDHVPTLLLGRRSQVLSSNGLLREVLGWPAEPGASFTRWLFLDPAARERITNWANFAASAVGALRYELGRSPEDQHLASLVRELCRGDPDVERCWNDQRMTFRSSLAKHVAHPVAGPLSFDIKSVVGPNDPDQRLVVYTVEPDSPTARVLTMLVNWATAPADNNR